MLVMESFSKFVRFFPVRALTSRAVLRCNRNMTFTSFEVRTSIVRQAQSVQV